MVHVILSYSPWVRYIMDTWVPGDTIFSGPEDPGPWDPGPRDPNWHALCMYIWYGSLEPR